MGDQTRDNLKRVVISGASGLVGSRLVQFLDSQGYEVWCLVRDEPEIDKNEIGWNPNQGQLIAAELENFDAVIHLSGENIAQRWSPAAKQRILESRIKSTQLISKTIASLENPPKTFLCASAVGYYGNQDGELAESAPAGEGFLADVCKVWETACSPLQDTNTRVINIRLGTVLSKQGGMLKKILLPFQLGLGGRIGSGKQGFSWIHLDDVIGAIEFLLKNQIITGPVNLTAPQPTDNVGFTKTFGQALHRPTIFPLPEIAVKLLFGEMGQKVLLEGAKVIPTKLLESGYTFRYPELLPAIKAEL